MLTLLRRHSLSLTGLDMRQGEVRDCVSANVPRPALVVNLFAALGSSCHVAVESRNVL